MKYFIVAATLAISTVPAFATDVGMSINIGQPGMYGRIDIGNYPRPQIIYPAPVMIQPVPMRMSPQPVYLHVPPGHRNNWGRHCHRYGACGQPVYFVQDGWYNNVYAPSYYGYGNVGWDDGYRGYYREGGYYNRGGHDRGHNRGRGRKHDRD